MYGKIIAKTNRIIWLDVDGQSKMRDYLPDGYLGVPWSGPVEWKWTKHPRFTIQAIRAFSSNGSVVLDPFAGQGTIPALCRQEYRYYVGFEFDSARAERARARVRETQPPLFVVDAPTQAALL